MLFFLLSLYVLMIMLLLLLLPLLGPSTDRFAKAQALALQFESCTCGQSGTFGCMFDGLCLNKMSDVINLP